MESAGVLNVKEIVDDLIEDCVGSSGLFSPLDVRVLFAPHLSREIEGVSCGRYTIRRSDAGHDTR